ncbi:GNAT family N-acetyltransferase [Limobrevibacterium gyesilva]|uniref:GNAT family N-acetyltransferase n=1 Tax=Limobrevibacterium gyesilva TaxID=2991712 RepID=A0AA42CH03_9PROT|nr:GNAT family N-acetyltransferase [Limobrevibacterium gyesilva]
MASWRSAYRGILPDDYIDGALADDLIAGWQAKFTAAPEPDFVLVAESAGAATGFIAVLPEDNGTPDGRWAYIDNLHVAPGLRGSGLGRALLREAARLSCEAGLRRAYLWVFARNLGAIRFYDRLQGQATAQATRPVGGHPVAMVRYAWSDLALLSEAVSG